TVEPVLQLASGFQPNAVRLEKHPAAVFQDDGELQLAIAGIGANDLANLVERIGAVLALVDPHDDAGSVPRVELIERNQLVDDQIRFFAAATVDRPTDEQDTVGCDQV